MRKWRHLLHMTSVRHPSFQIHNGTTWHHIRIHKRQVIIFRPCHFTGGGVGRSRSESPTYCTGICYSVDERKADLAHFVHKKVRTLLSSTPDHLLCQDACFGWSLPKQKPDNSTPWPTIQDGFNFNIKIHSPLILTDSTTQCRIAYISQQNDARRKMLQLYNWN